LGTISAHLATSFTPSGPHTHFVGTTENPLQAPGRGPDSVRAFWRITSLLPSLLFSPLQPPPPPSPRFEQFKRSHWSEDVIFWPPAGLSLSGPLTLLNTPFLTWGISPPPLRSAAVKALRAVLFKPTGTTPFFRELPVFFWSGHTGPGPRGHTCSQRLSPPLFFFSPGAATQTASFRASALLSVLSPFGRSCELFCRTKPPHYLLYTSPSLFFCRVGPQCPQCFFFFPIK